MMSRANDYVVEVDAASLCMPRGSADSESCGFVEIDHHVPSQGVLAVYEATSDLTRCLWYWSAV